jgi:hypothetical protein
MTIIRWVVQQKRVRGTLSKLHPKPSDSGFDVDFWVSNRLWRTRLISPADGRKENRQAWQYLPINKVVHLAD